MICLDGMAYCKMDSLVQIHFTTYMDHPIGMGLLVVKRMVGYNIFFFTNEPDHLDDAACCKEEGQVRQRI